MSKRVRRDIFALFLFAKRFIRGLLAQSQGIDLEDAVIAKFERTSEKIGYDCKLFRRSA